MKTQGLPGLLDTVVASLTEGVTVLDATGTFLLANGAAKDAMGFGPDGLPGNRALIVALRPDGTSMPLEERPTSRAFAGETVMGEHVIHRGPTGDRMMVVSAVPLSPDPETGVRRCLCVFHDVTEEYAARTELMAFASVVAHDLRNPPAAIGTWAELAEVTLAEGDGLSAEFASEMVARLHTAVLRMSVLIDDLLAHALTRDAVLDVVDVGVDELVAGIVGDRGAAAEVSWGSLPVVRADRTLLRQALDNLVGNALKYVAPGQQAEVRVEAIVDEGSVAIRVVDRGIGIPDGAHGEVFREFSRVCPDGYTGTGLGLSIVRRVAERHGGMALAMANTDGPGTTVELRLPR